MSDLKKEQVRDDNYNELSNKLDAIHKLVTLGSKEVLQIEDVAILTGLSKSHIYRLTSKKRFRIQSQQVDLFISKGQK